MAIGRGPQRSQLAYPSPNGKISRKHCIVGYEESSRRFILEDSSTNGTYIYPRARLTNGQPVYLEAGLRFYLGDPDEQYELRIDQYIKKPLIEASMIVYKL
jgi:predicted component of type VI protein secretion system